MNARGPVLRMPSHSFWSDFARKFLSLLLLIEVATASSRVALARTSGAFLTDAHDDAGGVFWRKKDSSSGRAFRETPQLIARKLRDFDRLVLDLPEHKKTHVQTASRHPSITSRQLKLAFLRCEDFDTAKAVRRYCSYWKKRVEIFGEKRAFQPLTIHNMREDEAALQQGVVSVIERRGAKSNYLYLRGSKADKSKYNSMNLVRSIWYAAHALIEDEQVQKQGLIIVDYAEGTKLSEVDLNVGKLMKQSINECLPLRVVAHHWCNPPSWVNSMQPMVRAFTGERMRNRLHIMHTGTPNQVSNTLQRKYGFRKEELPPEVGGSYPLDVREWLTRRLYAGK